MTDNKYYTPPSLCKHNDPKVIFIDTDEVYKANDKEIQEMAKKLADDITLRAAKAISYKNEQGDLMYIVQDKALNKAQGIDGESCLLSDNDFTIWSHFNA